MLYILNGLCNPRGPVMQPEFFKEGGGQNSIVTFIDNIYNIYNIYTYKYWYTFWSKGPPFPCCTTVYCRDLSSESVV